MAEKFRNQVKFQNGQVIDLAILKPGFELARPFQNQERFQNGQVNYLAVSKRPGFQNGREQRHSRMRLAAKFEQGPIFKMQATHCKSHLRKHSI